MCCKQSDSPLNVFQKSTPTHKCTLNSHKWALRFYPPTHTQSHQPTTSHTHPHPPTRTHNYPYPPKLFPRTFFRCNLNGRKNYVVSTCFFDVILMIEKTTLFARTFFKEISMGKNSTSFLVSCKLLKTFEEVFLC